MRLMAAILATASGLMLSACEQQFDEKFEDNLEELTSEAGEIQAQTDARLGAGREADKAIEEAEEAPQ